MILATAAVSMRSALKYRRDWNKNSPTVKLLRKFMPKGSKGYRVYVPIGTNDLHKNIVVPPAVRYALRKAGFAVSDYLAKKCVKISDKQQRNVFNIGKVIAKDPTAKAAFDNDPQLQNTAAQAEFQLVISCHPYDVIGMSTGRDWDNTSCMRLKDYRENQSDGVYKDHMERDVAEGTIVVYAIRSDDTNIQHPLCRCLLKPFVNRDSGKAEVLYRRESRVYGNKVQGFDAALARFMRKLNAKAPSGDYTLISGLYDDGVGEYHRHSKVNVHSTHIDPENARDILKEKPEEFPNWARAFINQEQLEDNSPHNILSGIIHMIEEFKISPKYVRPVSRLILADPGMMRHLVNMFDPQLARPIGRPAYAALFSYEPLRKEVLEQVNDRIKAGQYSESTLHEGEFVMSFLSPEHAATVHADISTPYKCSRLATEILEGEREANAQTFENYPELANAMRVILKAARAASRYDADRFGQQQIYKYANMLPDAPTHSEFEILEMARTNNQWGLYFAAMLEAEKENPPLYGKLIDAKNDLVYRLAFLQNDKFRRILAHRCPPAMIPHRDVALRELILESAQPNNNVMRDLLPVLQKIGIPVADFHRVAGVIQRHHLLVPYVYAKYTDTMDVILNWRAVNNIYGDYKGVPLVRYDDDDQQQMYDMIGTLNSMLKRPLNLPFDYVVNPDYEKRYLEEPTIANLPIDYHRYPDFLSEEIVQEIDLMEFIGSDLGYSWSQKLEKGRGLAEAARLLMQLIEAQAMNPATLKKQLLKNVDKPEDYSGMTNIPAIVRDMILDGYGKQAFDALAEYGQKIVDFANTYPDLRDNSFYPDAVAFYGDKYEENEIYAAAPQIKRAAGAIRDMVERWANGMPGFLKYFTNTEKPEDYGNFDALKSAIADLEKYRDK